MQKYLLLYGLKWFEDSAHSKIIVVFRAIESTNDEIYNTEMIVVGLFLSFCHFCSLLFFSLQPFHDFLSLLVFVDHDIADTEISNNYGCQTEHIICILADDGLIISDCFIISFQNKEDMGYIELPSLVVSTELGTLSEEFLNYRVVLFIPVYLRLRHKHRNVLL